MKIMRFNTFDERKDDLDLFVKVTKDEAYRIIKSLASQLHNNSSNSGREEFYDEEGNYFTIGIKGE